MYFCFTASEPLAATDNVASSKDHELTADTAVASAHATQLSVCSSFMVNGSMCLYVNQ